MSDYNNEHTLDLISKINGLLQPISLGADAGQRIIELRKILVSNQAQEILNYSINNPAMENSVTFNYEPNILYKILGLYDVDKYELFWTLLSNINLIKLCEIETGKISIKEIKQFLQNSLINNEDQELFLTKISQELSNKIKDNKISLTELLPLALKYNFKEIVICLMNSELDVNLSMLEYHYEDENKQQIRILANPNSIILAVNNLISSKQFDQDLLILQALLLQHNADLNLWFEEENVEQRTAIKVKQYVENVLAEIFNSSTNIEQQLQILTFLHKNGLKFNYDLIKIDNYHQLKSLVNLFINGCGIEQNDYVLSDEQIFILQILYGICPKDHNNNSILIKYITDQIIKEKLEKIDGRTYDNGRTLLHKAVENNQINEVQTLISKGAYINALAVNNHTPLYYAAEKGHINILNILILNGGMVNAKTICDITPLIAAADNNHPECITKLLENGANIDQADHHSKTSLYFTVLKNYTQCTKILLDNGANINIKDTDYYKKIPYQIANIYQYTAILDLLETRSKLDQKKALAREEFEQQKTLEQQKFAPQILEQQKPEQQAVKKDQGHNSISAYGNPPTAAHDYQYYKDQGHNFISAYIKSKFHSKNYEFELPRAMLFLATVIVTACTAISPFSFGFLLTLETGFLNMLNNLLWDKHQADPFSDNRENNTFFNMVIKPIAWGTILPGYVWRYEQEQKQPSQSHQL